MDTIISLLEALIQWVECIPYTIICVVIAFANYLLDLLIYIPQQIFALFGQGFVAFFNLIPIPSFISSMQSYVDFLSTTMGYFFILLRLNSVSVIIIGAYIVRFIIRRIPLVG